MTDPMNPSSAPSDTENTLSTAVDYWLSSPSLREDAMTLSFAYAVAWALGKGDGVPEPSTDLARLIDATMRGRKEEIFASFQTASTALLTNLEQGGVGMWVPFETPIKS